ncbi:MAG: tRNA (adenosine(37)-N6)-dimethylallyltransferase MiaA [Gammaproteobacteria bacterium]|nr:tRNA (adenosine(37)-N6)-dimethylallyltransferase MiaA [Gammaproteobacteria bacterium]
MGPTASGKTDVAIQLCQRFPFDVISVDSALVYRGMDIGTAKPDPDTLRHTPHRLIDIRNPDEGYSAGDFVRDARAEMDTIFAAGRVPLLVGGTMMYFRALTGGIADLPAADEQIRADIDRDAANLGWPALHGRLRDIDPEAAERINPNDSQRIQRALEVFMASGKPLSQWQLQARDEARQDVGFIKIALQPATRERLHARIEQRLNLMLNNGFIEEVKELYQLPGLTAKSPSMRSVGYRQIWQHLDGETTLDEAGTKALYATRQLAKRQITWLRSESDLNSFDPLEVGTVDAISAFLVDRLA